MRHSANDLYCGQEEKVKSKYWALLLVVVVLVLGMMACTQAQDQQEPQDLKQEIQESKPVETVKPTPEPVETAPQEDMEPSESMEPVESEPQAEPSESVEPTPEVTPAPTPKPISTPAPAPVQTPEPVTDVSTSTGGGTGGDTNYDLYKEAGIAPYTPDMGDPADAGVRDSTTHINPDADAQNQWTYDHIRHGGN